MKPFPPPIELTCFWRVKFLNVWFLYRLKINQSVSSWISRLAIIIFLHDIIFEKLNFSSDQKFNILFFFVGVLFVCSQMSEPHSGLTLKCAKCGVVSTTALSATTASNAMLVLIIYIFLLQILCSACEKKMLQWWKIKTANIEHN